MQEVTLLIKQVWDWWLSTARHPVFATFANLLGVFAGFLGALYTDDIRNAFPFYSGPYTGVSVHSIVFWTGFSVFALTFLSREYSTDNGFDMLTGVGVPSQFFPLTEIGRAHV